MCSADEATLVDTVYGTNLNTSAAACAKRVVDGRKIVLDGDSAVGTGLLTLHTADTAVRAVLAHVCALVVIGALNDHSRGIVYKLDNIIGTFAGTYSTSNAFSWINMRYTVEETDSILGTYPYTVAVSKTSKGTSLVAAI